MSAIQKIIQKSALQYVSQYGYAMPAVHKKALVAMEICRTERMGTNLYQCPDCGHSEVAMRSCSNRSCPTCQTDKGREWLQKNAQRLLPCAYFMVTFTIPEQLRHIVRSNQRLIYDMMFGCAWKSMKKISADPKYLGVKKMGAMGILHTWTRQMQYHPHIHFLVPAGGIDKDGNWCAGRADFLFPVRALSRLFRAKVLEELKNAGIAYPPKLWNIEWNVNCENKGNGQRALGYLSNYLFRVAISNNRIVESDMQSVTFRYKKRTSDKYRKAKVSNLEFIRRYLQHVLPNGFVKVRHYGFMSAASTCDIAELAKQVLDGLELPLNDQAQQHKPMGYRCSCGARMLLAMLMGPTVITCNAKGEMQT